MPTYKLTAVNTTGALKIETDSTRVDFLIPDDVSLNYDVTNSVINIGTGAIQFQLTVSNSRDSSGNPFADFAAIKTFIEGIFFLINGGVKEYWALLNQGSGNAPTATVLLNTLGEVPTFGYDATGDYQLNTVGAVFTQNKTYLDFRHKISDVGNFTASNAFWFDFQRNSATQIDIYSTRGDGTTATDDALINTEIHIYIFP